MLDMIQLAGVLVISGLGVVYVGLIRVCEQVKR